MVLDNMSPKEYQEHANNTLDQQVDKYYRELLYRAKTQLRSCSKQFPKHIELKVLPHTDRIYHDAALKLACTRLIRHYESLGWVAKISIDHSILGVYETSSHILHLTSNCGPLTRFWYKLSSRY